MEFHGGCVGHTTIIWDYKFKWTSEHPTIAEVQDLLFSYDELATKALDDLDEISPPKSKGWKCPHGSGEGQRDLLALIEEHSSSNETLGKLWGEISTVPDWVDWDQIARGQRVVYQYNGQILLGLLYRSLVGGMGAFRVVEVLSRTGGFGIQVTRRRLLETLQHFMEVVENIDAVKPGGKGYETSVRVRLLHAAVRRRLIQLEREKPGYFDMQKLGVPINDLHAIGTISVYSAAIAYMALPRQGVNLTPQQTEDYFALWRWVGYLLGTPVDWMATPSRTKAMMEAVMAAEVQPSEHSKILANNILTAETDAPPLKASREYLAAQAYQLNGNDLSQALGIDKPGLYYRALVWLQCLLLLGMSWSYPWLPASYRDRKDKKFIAYMEEIMTSQKMGGNGEKAKFQPQYEPMLGKMTELGKFEKALVTKARGYSTAIFVVVMVMALGAAVSLLHVSGELQGVEDRMMATLMTQKQILQGLS